jgi:SAM-dependent methyltransferase
MSIPGLEQWLESPQGRYILDWESARIDDAVADIFGYNALQLGLPQLDLLRENRIPFRQSAGEPGTRVPVSVNCDLRQLPFAANSIDLVVMPHVLEFYDDPHQILREVERILIPEGQVVITGFNPFSSWGLRRYLPGGHTGFPWCGRYLTATRARDWLQLLGFEVERPTFGCHAPPMQTRKWLHRWQRLDAAGERAWPFVGGVYLLRAIKRVHSMRLILPRWQGSARRTKALAPITQKETPSHGQ